MSRDTTEHHSIDYSPLHPSIKHDRWSPLATSTYATTGAAVLIFLMTFSYRPLPLYLMIGAAIASVAGALYSRKLFLRANPAQPDDLWQFANANNLRVISHQPATDLRRHVLIRQRLSSIIQDFASRHV